MPDLPQSLSLPAGTRVRVKRGMWAGLAGTVDALSTSVAGPEVRIVKVDPVPAVTKRTRTREATPAQIFAPKNGLIVVAVRDLEADAAAAA